MTREDVISGLEKCAASECNEKCPYNGINYGCRPRLMLDAAELLKEQEAVEPIPPTDDSDLWRCGYCNSQIFRCTHQRFCHECGRKVKWE